MKALTGLDERDRATRRPQKLSELRALVTDPLSRDPGTADASLTGVLDTLNNKAEDILRALRAANSIDGLSVKRRHDGADSTRRSRPRHATNSEAE